MNSALVLHAARGFTLLEMLVVVLIMGIVVGTVSVRLQPRDRDRLHIEADRLAQLLDLAGTESRITGRAIAWTCDGTSYRFWRVQGNGEWMEVRDNELLRARRLPHGMLISQLRVEATAPQRAMRLEFSPAGLASAFSLTLSFGDELSVVTASPVGDLRVSSAAENAHGDVASR